MRGLFTKVFLFFWVAQSLTFLITTLYIFQHHYGPRPDQSMDALSAMMLNQGKTSAELYESRGCPALMQYSAMLGDDVYLTDDTKHVLCRPILSASPSSALDGIRQGAEATGVEANGQLFWGIRFKSARVRNYYYVYSRPLKPPPHSTIATVWFFARSQLIVAIIVCGLTTFLLVLFLTRPIAKLRAAARALAGGQLTTRIASASTNPWLGSDELQGLTHDFNDMAERLELLVDAHRILLRDVSHELRSPLARLSVALELTREDAPASTQVHLQRIERETARLNLLIGNLLRLSAMELINELNNVQSFDLLQLVEELLQDAEFEASQRSCSVSLIGQVECQIAGTAELIYSAVENVVRNAVRYTAIGSVVEIRLASELRDEQQIVVLTVSDRGSGLPEDELENIFRPFYRTDSARQSITGGFGIGLALAERAVRLHHGGIKAEKRPGGGLTIVLWLPCAES
jgi:two-component system sensor histidine kinase CpxA